MFTLTKDRAFALVVIAVVAILLVESRDIRPATSWQPYGSAFYPRLVLSAVGLLSVLLLVQSILSVGPGQPAVLPQVASFFRQNPRVPALFALFAAYVAMMPIIGYLAATIGFLALSFLLLAVCKTQRGAMISAVLAAAVPVVVFVVFETVLSIRLP